ncbi:MAG: mRNA surveillance protein pelota [Desulfurococcales archaeon]|nr:mRNA surveillance protein pelota [Desulfurococcales archaeon]
MRILETDLKKGYIKLVPENQDDLWLLYNIIQENDQVIAKTTREVKSDKSGGSKRIPMTLTIKVKNLEFQPFTSRLRVRGVVLEGPERFGVKGHYHTLNIEPGTIVTIFKDRWPKYMLKKLEKALKERGRILLIAFDYDELAIGIMSHQGIKILVEKPSQIPGKDSPSYEEIRKKYINEILKLVKEYVKRYNIDYVIIASPGFLKNELTKKIMDMDLGVHITVDTVSTGGVSGIYELSRRDSIKEALKELEVIKAGKILDNFLYLIIKDDSMVAYGVDEVSKAVENNAVKELVVSEELIRSPDEELRRRVEEILIEADKRGAEIVIAPSSSEISKRVMGFGGIIAILRYQLKFLRETTNKQ